MTFHLNTQDDLDAALRVLVERDARLKPVMDMTGENVRFFIEDLIACRQQADQQGERIIALSVSVYVPVCRCR